MKKQRLDEFLKLFHASTINYPFQQFCPCTLWFPFSLCSQFPLQRMKPVDLGLLPCFQQKCCFRHSSSVTPQRSLLCNNINVIRSYLMLIAYNLLLYQQSYHLPLFFIAVWRVIVIVSTQQSACQSLCRSIASFPLLWCLPPTPLPVTLCSQALSLYTRFSVSVRHGTCTYIANVCKHMYMVWSRFTQITFQSRRNITLACTEKNLNAAH